MNKDGALGDGPSQPELNFDLEDPNMSSGRIVQIIGAVLDVEFPRDSVPRVYDALKVTEKGLTLRGAAAVRRRRCSNNCYGIV